MTQKPFFPNRVARNTGAVICHHRGGSPVCQNCWKARGVHFLNMHYGAKSSHTGLERLDRHGLQVGQKNDKKPFFQNRVARSTAMVTWRHCGVSVICLDC